MKPKERQEARNLRMQGFSIPRIAQTLAVSKSSASLWVRDIVLTEPQKEALAVSQRENREAFAARCKARGEMDPDLPLTVQTENLRKQGLSYGTIAGILGIKTAQVRAACQGMTLSGEERAVIEASYASRRSRLEKMWGKSREAALSRRAVWSIEARKQYPSLMKSPDFVFGLGLYAGEGGKAGSRVDISNSDPLLISAGFRFYEAIGIPRNEVRFLVAIYEDIDEREAKAFWEKSVEASPKIMGASKSRSSKGKRKPSYFGTASIRYHSVEHLTKILTWIEMACEPREHVSEHISRKNGL